MAKPDGISEGDGTARTIRRVMSAKRHLPGLMGLRGLAALMIVTFHFAPNVEMPVQFSIIKSHFGMGVPLFFVLSGFSLMHSTKPSIGSKDWIEVYLVKRMFRIAPLFYVMIVFFSVYNFFVWNLAPTASPIIINLLFLHNLVPGYHESIVWAGWTLGVEMLFYALFPAVLVGVRTIMRGLLLFLLSLAAGLAARELLAAKGMGEYAALSFVGNVFYFAAGIAAYLIYERLASSRFVKLPLGPLVEFIILASAWAMVFTPVGAALVGKNRYDIVVWAVLFGAASIWQAFWPSWLLSSRAFQYCGERSYSIYLVHAVTIFRLAPFYALIYTAFGNTMASFLVSATVALIAVLCATAIAYELVERPGMRWGAAIIARRWPR